MPIALGQTIHGVQISTADEDWTGLSSAAARRKLQNRINQRIYRKRRSAKTSQHAIVQRDVEEARHELGVCSNDRNTENTSVSSSSTPNSMRSVTPGSPVPFRDLTNSQLEQLMARYEKFINRHYFLGSPKTDLLLTLIQFNVLRGLFMNAASISLDREWCDEDAISPWYAQPADQGATRYPQSLTPTPLQRLITHHPWIDLFPIPKLRENLLNASDNYDEWAICNDLVDFCGVTHDETGLIVWGDPWLSSSWEVSESFLAKWGWVVEGCFELMASTNYWRRERGLQELDPGRVRWKGRK